MNRATHAELIRHLETYDAQIAIKMCFADRVVRARTDCSDTCE